MTEVTGTWDLVPGMDAEKLGEIVASVHALLRKAPGFVELRANRNLLGSPYARVTLLWQTLADWATFIESSEYRELDAAFRSFVTNMKIDVWGPSPALPEPVRPR